MSIQDDLDQINQKIEDNKDFVLYADVGTIPNADMDNNLIQVARLGEASHDAAQISLIAAEDTQLTFVAVTNLAGEAATSAAEAEYWAGQSGEVVSVQGKKGVVSLVQEDFPWMGAGQLLTADDLPQATPAELNEGTQTAPRIYAPKTFYDAAAFVELTSAASITPDLDAGNNFNLALEHNATLNNPTGAKSGQTGTIVVTHDGSSTLSYGANWKFSGGAPDLSTEATTDIITYLVVSPTMILAVLGEDFS